MENKDIKIAQLAALMNLNGYSGDVHINGIEQGSLWQVLTNCIEIRNKMENHAFKDPVELTHYSFNEDKSRYLQSKFIIELDNPNRFRIASISYLNYDIQHNLIRCKTIKAIGTIDIPKIEKARLWVSPEFENSKIKKGLQL